MGWPDKKGKKKLDRKAGAKHAGAVARDAAITGRKVEDPSTYFKGGSQVQKQKGIRIGFWGHEKVGKTHDALTFPKPIYIIDTEFGTYPLLDKNHPEFWPWLAESGVVDEDQIMVFEAAVLDEHSGEPDPLLCLSAIERALDSLGSVNKGTIILDSGTDVWTFISTWLEGVAVKRSATTGDKYQFEWGKANARYRLLMMRLLTKRSMNIIITGQERAVYDSDGKATSLTKAQWQKKTGHWVDIVINCTKASDGKFRGRVDACRWGKYTNKMINPPVYENIIKWAKEECNKDIPPMGWLTVDEYLQSLQSVDDKIEEAIEEPEVET